MIAANDTGNALKRNSGEHGMILAGFDNANAALTITRLKIFRNLSFKRIKTCKNPQAASDGGWVYAVGFAEFQLHSNRHE